MANYFDTGILLTAGFSLSSQAPLDGRSVVELLTDLDTHIAENRAYEGMCVYVKENKKNYIYNGTAWEEFVGGGGSSEEQIKDWVSGSSYLEGDYIYHEGEIYRCLTSNNDVDFDEANWKQLTYGIDELSKEDVEGLLGLTKEEIEAMADLILDTEVRIDKTYSSSKIYTDIQQCLEDSKTYTLEEIARASTASYKVVTDVIDMTEERYLYLLHDGTDNYDIYIVETDGTPTRIGYTQIDISNYYTKEEVDELLEEGGSGVYSTTTPVNNPIGGIKRGDEFTNKPISEIIDLMLHVVERVKVALSSSVSGGIREIGDTSISTSTFTINATKGTNPVVSVKLFKDSVEVQDFADVENGGSFTYDGGAITTDTAFVAKANDGDGDIASTTITYKFVSPMYIGSSNNGLDVFSEVDATGLTKKIVDKNTKTIQAFTHTQQHMCFVVPNTWNNTPTIKDQNNFDITTAFSKKTIQITGLDGVARDYIAFVSNDKSTLSNYSITISF